MKVGVLKPVIRDNKLFFEREKAPQEMQFAEIENISVNLKRLNIERYMIRRSKPQKKLIPELQQTIVGKKRV